MPVLPRRINRNVRAFLTLYHDHLPFVTYAELPKEPIQRLTIVDSQTLPSLRNAQDDMEVELIDHHPAGEGLDPTWTAHLETVGATTTLLVEALQERDGTRDWVAATLMMLGIYEDTGSLSYAGTTARDLQAGAWLLERGANLEVVSHFLSQPLSEGQRRLYEALIDSIELYDIHGFSIMVARADAGDLVDEISTLAQKLRDVYEPAALFVLVALGGRIQVVARSTHDAIDVGQVATALGGGGHTRAAAALVRDQTLDQVHARLVEILPSMIEPATVVADIMSRGPRLLQADETISEAAKRMQRFGHEGYPVVDEQGVVGLLTRRAVDRAMSHGMDDRPVRSVMNAGRFQVHPGDSVHTLQQAMIEHDWGQVPVADPESGEIIGIVTRTDLLNLLARPSDTGREQALNERLEAALPPERLRLLKLIAEQAESFDLALYIVGGFVRDLILGQPSVDFDLVVEGDAIRLVRALARDFGGKVSSHRRFGTAKWILEPLNSGLKSALSVEHNHLADLPASIDFVTARTEFYTYPSALPSVIRGSIKLDLHRRDFSINTLALRLDGRFYGQILDFWGGGRDLQRQLIRVLHSLSFVDDPTRMLRAVRLEQRLDFQIETRSLELLKQALPLLDRVSGERIRSELELIFREDQHAASLQRLDDLGLLKAIDPALAWDAWLRARFAQVAAFEAPQAWRLEAQLNPETMFYALWLLRLTEDEARRVARRLRFPLQQREIVLQTQALARRVQSWTQPAPSEVVRQLHGASEATLAALWLADYDQRHALESYLTNWRWIQPAIGGDTLKEMGLPPGPAFARILWRLRAAWLDGELRSPEEERRLASELVAAELKDG
jgi:tRNA nucleotidyltransferase (CCA-adding enzyme)